MCIVINELELNLIFWRFLALPYSVNGLLRNIMNGRDSKNLDFGLRNLRTEYYGMVWKTSHAQITD